MTSNMNNHVFKGHKTLLGSKYVTYGELELPSRYDVFAKSSSGFDWGNGGSSSQQLAFSILCQLSDESLAKENVAKFTSDVVKNLNSRDWILHSMDVIEWIEENCEPQAKEMLKEETLREESVKTLKKTKKTKKSNVVKNVCKELGITQKNLAEILEVPEGTVSSWAVKNEIPRLGKKAIEFYIINVKNQKIVDSYRSFQELLKAS